MGMRRTRDKGNVTSKPEVVFRTQRPCYRYTAALVTASLVSGPTLVSEGAVPTADTDVFEESGEAGTGGVSRARRANHVFSVGDGVSGRASRDENVE